MAVLNFIQQVLSTPAIFVGLLALLGLALQKKMHRPWSREPLKRF